MHRSDSPGTAAELVDLAAAQFDLELAPARRPLPPARFAAVAAAVIALGALALVQLLTGRPFAGTDGETLAGVAVGAGVYLLIAAQLGRRAVRPGLDRPGTGR